MFKETIAINTITKILSLWEKQKEKLEGAIEALKEVISNNKAEIQRKQRAFEEEKKEIELKNRLLKRKIEDASKFKNNIDRMFE